VLDPGPALIGCAQDLSNNLHGKILRIDPNVPAPGTYSIPPDKSFVDAAGG